ncbi:MAG: flagellar basal-body rod protein FlgF [Tepidimonas sp.]|uniref:flagellar basal-body rod protein FlgF n=1 Tax=Tepidimonas sp. TaxID=2002775 RepID=UPI00298F15EF|nr:flagellar basal-body rod protein FlgF [Tepidimonas sp.]MCS6810382.1 flagellar basal-body rod protein FlgF [Tepidimonas sp.]MDW8337376.1 flagellar basal-body rod protein FlgF [Tepidimonas sp.]
MDRVVFTAASGAKAAMQRHQVIAHNLANVTTTGFRAELSTFRAVPLRGEGATTRVHALEATPGYLDKPGNLQSTGRPLDVAAVGRAFFAIQGLDGTEAYTRAGALQIDAQGQLVGFNGLPMLSTGGAPIQVPNGAQVTIGRDGTVSAKAGNEAPQVLGRLKLVTPPEGQRLKRGEDGLFRAPDGQPLAADDNARLVDGMLEGSNVDPIAAMVDMIAATRLYEAQMRLVQSAEKNDQTAAQLLSVNA